jgi:hypothetical protein
MNKFQIKNAASSYIEDITVVFLYGDGHNWEVDTKLHWKYFRDNSCRSIAIGRQNDCRHCPSSPRNAQFDQVEGNEPDFAK